MELKVCIDKSTIAANTETHTDTEWVHVDGKKLTYTHAPIYNDFYRKLSYIIRDRNFIDLKTTVAITGEEIQWVTIFSNSVTSGVFDIFKSMGIYAPKIVIGVNNKTNTIYTTAKLCRDLNKYSENQRAALTMYMLTLAHFVVETVNNCVSFTYDGTTGVVRTASPLSNFEKLIRTFEDEETWYIKDTNNDNYTTVNFYNTTHTSTADTYANTEAIKIGAVKHKSGKIAGIASIAIGSAKYTFVMSERVTYTTFDLCNIEISSDSLATCVASAYPKSFSLCKVDKLPLSNEMTLIELEGEDFEETAKTEKLPSWLTSWVLYMLAKGAKFAECSDLEHLTSAYGVKAAEGSSAITCMSPEEMRKFYDSDAYAQELYKQVKPYYDSYNLETNIIANLKGFSNGAIYSMVFVGESGTGKSTAARVIPSRCGLPYVSVNFSVNIEEADLFGSMVPNAKKASSEDPEFVWTDGVITKAVRNGYCVILEEINFARPGVLGKLNSLLDENRQIDLATGEIVRAHPNFRVIATCNIAYEGTNRFNKALINRFDDVTVFRDLDRTEAISVIKARTGYANGTKISKVYDVYEALKKFATEQNINAVVSMRQLLNIFTKGRYYSDAKDAVQRIMINGAFIEDVEYQKVFEETVYKAFDLKFKI